MAIDMNSSSLEQYLNITSSNYLYNDYKTRWQFYLESYLGGAEYRQAGHLVRYQLETAREYAARLDSTPYDNHCKSVISTYKTVETGPGRPVYLLLGTKNKTNLSCMEPI